MTFKEKIFLQLATMVTAKIDGLKYQLQELQESTAGETKSTAGDKYETARAMLQIEQDNVRRQLQEALEMQAQFVSLKQEQQSSIIVPGSLIKTDKGWLLLGTALGKTTIDDTVVIALSPQSPLGKKLLGLKAGNVASVNNIDYKIEIVE